MTPEFEGKVALVTGTSSGIGRATAIAFGRGGARVVASDVDREGGADTAARTTRSTTQASRMTWRTPSSAPPRASVAGLVGFRSLPAYGASEGVLIELTGATAIELADTDTRVNSGLPGVIRAPMVERVIAGDAELEARYTALEPIGRMGEPEEIALVADGGLVAQ